MMSAMMRCCCPSLRWLAASVTATFSFFLSCCVCSYLSLCPLVCPHSLPRYLSLLPLRPPRPSSCPLVTHSHLHSHIPHSSFVGILHPIVSMNHHAAKQLQPCVRAALARHTRSLLLPRTSTSSPIFFPRSRAQTCTQGHFTAFARHLSSNSSSAKTSFEVNIQKRNDLNLAVT